MCRLLTLILLLLIPIACSQGDVTYPQRNMPPELRNDPAQLTKARQLFLEHCAVCHGHSSEGRTPRADFFQPPAPDFSAPAYSKIDPAYLFWRISEGKTVEPFRSQGSVMPAWGEHFSDEQIWQLVAYLQSRARY